VLFGISDADSCLVFLVSVIKGYHLWEPSTLKHVAVV
jgi:hypothetical protein